MKKQTPSLTVNSDVVNEMIKDAEKRGFNNGYKGYNDYKEGEYPLLKKSLEECGLLDKGERQW